MSGTLRPEDRCRSAQYPVPSIDVVMACRRSEAFAEDLPQPPATRVAPATRLRLARPRRRTSGALWLDAFRARGLSAGT